MSSNGTSAERSLVAECGVPIDFYYYLTICDCFPFFTKAEIVMHDNTEKIRLLCPANALPDSFDCLPTTIVPGGYDSGAWIYLSIGHFKWIRHLTINRDAKRLPDDIWELDELRELKYCCRLTPTEIPQEIGKLDKLMRLDLGGALISSLPPSIGRLQHLKFLDLSCTRILLSLPEEIGSLGSLIELHLEGSAITLLPPSICQLSKLKHLNLYRMENLTELPTEIGRLQRLKFLSLSRAKRLKYLPRTIGNLGSLVKLDIQSTAIRYLPPGIGKLSKLIVLGLRRMKKLKELPKGIGNLGNLTELHLSGLAITSLPPSIGKLSQLELLNLSGTKNLTELPTEIGNLESLNQLRIDSSAISSLPDSLKTLQRPLNLHLSDCAIPELQNIITRIQFFKEFPSLISLDPIYMNLPSVRQNVHPILALNRARFLTGFGMAQPRLWPLLLSNASRATSWCRDDCNTYTTAPADAIYYCLIHGIGSFAQILDARNKRTEASN